MLLTGMAAAQDFTGVARVDMGKSKLSDSNDGLLLELGLSQGVPWRLFTLDAPPRVVLDFREVDWRGVDPALLDWAERASGVRVGRFYPGWSRMVIDLNGPFALNRSAMKIDAASGTAALSVSLSPVDDEAFAARSGAPALAGWEALEQGSESETARADPNAKVVIVIDPGHGGIDPGAEQGGMNEKELMLIFARELKEQLLRAGDIDVVMTRNDDRFVSLEQRVAIAHQVKADLFLSLHADALAEGNAHGATVYTLSESASDKASAALAERHNRSDLLAGIDLTGADDTVADVLMDLARQETQPRADQLAQAIKLGLKERDLPLNSRPIRSAGFSVLKSPDIPSVLLEVGFLSSERDRANLANPEWRAVMAQAVSEAIAAWRLADAAAADLVRQ